MYLLNWTFLSLKNGALERRLVEGEEGGLDFFSSSVWPIQFKCICIVLKTLDILKE